MACRQYFKIILLLNVVMTVLGQFTNMAWLQQAGCAYKLVLDKDTCPRGENQPSATEVNNLLQLIATQSNVIMQQQTSMLIYQQRLDNLSNTIDTLAQNSRGEVDAKTNNWTNIEEKVKTLEGLIVDIQGNNGCSQLLVSGETPIPDPSISASSHWSVAHSPQASRIYTTTDSGCWATKVNNQNQWIKFDYGRTKKVSAILTKGRHTAYSQFVRKFKLYYSTDGSRWSVYQEIDGRDKIFPGNFDAETIRKNLLEPPVVARYVRINPVTWFGHISMRIDFLGCNP